MGKRINIEKTSKKQEIILKLHFVNIITKTETITRC
jgi:hypothetical protein